MMLTPTLRALARRLRAQTFDLLQEEVARLGDENEALRQENDSLRRRLAWAEDCAESWREDAISALNEAANACGGAPGLTRDGRLVVVPPGGLHA